MKPRILWSFSLLFGLLSARSAYSQIPTVALSSTTLTFDSQTVGTTSAAKVVTLNTTVAILNITGIAVTGTNAGDFAQTNTCVSPVAVGSNCTISVTFKPTDSGTRSASITITDNATGGPQTASLTGSGALAGICTTGVAAFCIDQPADGASQVTGKGGVAGDSVSLMVNNKSVGNSVPVNADGSFTITVNPALKQYNVVEVDEAASGAAAGAAPVAKIGPLSVTAATGSGSTSSLYTLALAGVDAMAASSAPTSPQYFAEFNLIAPLHWAGGRVCGGKKDQPVLDKDGKPKKDKGGKEIDVRLDEIYPLAGRCWAWFDPRIASVPPQNNTTLGSLSTPASLVTGIGSQSLAQVVQSLEFHGGGEFYLIKPWDGVAMGLKGTQEWSKTSLSIVFGAGSVTPVSAATGAQEFTLSCNLYDQFSTSGTGGASLQAQYPQLYAALQNYNNSSACSTTSGAPSPKQTTVAFVLPNRSRFYRDYFAGFRLRSFFFSGKCNKGGTDETQSPCTPKAIFPGTFDITFGQDETVTGGILRGAVMTLASSYPLPGTNGAIRTFGSTHMRLYSNRNSPALALVPSTSFTSLDQSSVVVQPIQPSDHDYFRLGVGVDLISLIRSKFNL